MNAMETIDFSVHAKTGKSPNDVSATEIYLPPSFKLPNVPQVISKKGQFLLTKKYFKI